MLKERIELEKYLEKKCSLIVMDKDNRETVVNALNEKYGFSLGLSTDLLTQQKNLSEVSEFVLFCMLDVFSLVEDVKELAVYFTPIELKQYSTQKLEKTSISFPIEISCIEIAHDQWIGKIDVALLMQLRQARLINYNVNAQRTLQRVERGENSFYRISINKGAINKIRASMESGVYIPNTITLNIPLDTDSEFYYDSEEKKLIIK